MTIRPWLAGLLCCWHWGLNAQPLDTAARELHKDRLLAVTIGGSALMVGSLVALDQAWYSQYERVPFHTFNDGADWMQMDKFGHTFTTYNVGRWGTGLLDWTGMNERTATWVGGSIGLAYMTAVEYMDGRSEGWGFSGWDMVANLAGTGMFIGQELGWGEQRIRLKYSSHPTDYAAQNPELLGSTGPERILKDYNGCTYWLSVNPATFGHKQGRARWLSVALGYGAEGLVSADPGTSEEMTGQAPYRQYYLSFDIDLERIPSRSKAVRTALFLLNCIKVPSPTLEYRSNGRWAGHWLYF